MRRVGIVLVVLTALFLPVGPSMIGWKGKADGTKFSDCANCRNWLDRIG